MSNRVPEIIKGFIPHFSKKSAGFTILEVIAAIFIISIGIVALINVIPSLSSGMSINSSRFTAAYLAQEGIEIVRNIRDGNLLEAYNRGDSTPWDEGLTNCGSGCEIDYHCVTVENPDTTDPAGHNCFGIYGTEGHFLKIDSANFYNYFSGNDTKYKRKITITGEVNDAIVSVLILWEDRGKNYQFSVQEKLYQW
ncbi:MAG: prepilin-type N-terminal cleavage/methylation domain-containing protein [Patescibacteria group bacterium]